MSRASTLCQKPYRGYRLLVIDGSDLHFTTDPTYRDTYFQSQPNTKGYNLLHLNAAYDLCNRLYVDALVQPRRLCNKGRALATMVGRSPIKGKTIVIADRGYESYNNLAHLERKGWNYVIRVKDLDSNGILSGLRLPSSGEFDRHIHLTLTKKQTKEVKAHPEIYNSSLPLLLLIFWIDRRTCITLLLSGCSFCPVQWCI
nr:transposase [Paenibacillus lentus]